MPPDSASLAAVSALFGLGAALAAYAVMNVRRRTATTRRLATFVVAEANPMRPPPAAVDHLRRWYHRAHGVVRTHPSAVRASLVLLALLGMLAGLATGSLLGFALAGLAAGLIFLVSDQTRAQRMLEMQGPAAIELMAAGLRAGYSVPQAIALVAEESPEPTASEFAQAAREIELGVGLTQALAHLARRTASPDYELVSLIAFVQHEVGGNLAQVLDSVAATVRERFELRQQVSALTAQQRLSSIVLTLLPPGVLLFLVLTNRPFVAPLLTEPVGRLLLAMAGVMLLLGWAVMRSIGRVEV